MKRLTKEETELLSKKTTIYIKNYIKKNIFSKSDLEFEFEKWLKRQKELIIYKRNKGVK